MLFSRTYIAYNACNYSVYLYFFTVLLLLNKNDMWSMKFSLITDYGVKLFGWKQVNAIPFGKLLDFNFTIQRQECWYNLFHNLIPPTFAKTNLCSKEKLYHLY